MITNNLITNVDEMERRNDMMETKIKAHSSTLIAVIGLIIAVASLIVGITALGLQYYNTVFNVNDTKAGETAYLDFEANREDKWGATFNAKPSSGWFYMRAKQIKGGSKATYNIYWKISTDSSWRTVYMQQVFSQNNVYAPNIMITQSNGRRNYDFMVQKTAGFVKASKLECDWIVR